MDLSKERTSDKASLTAVHPTKGETDIKIEVAGKDSELYQKEFADYRKRLIAQTKEKKVDPEASRKLVADLLAKITLSWENVEYDGKPLDCTFDNAYKLYADRQLTWLRDQVDDFANNRGNFLGN